MIRRIAAVLAAVFAPIAAAQLPGAETLAQLTTPPDLEVTLFAAEPLLRNPTAMDIDARGRVWITEAVNYRLFNHPVADERGDRIRVLEDTTGDGRADKAWTFYQDPSLQAPMGIAVIGDRVYICQSPDLFYLRDTTGDGRADEKTVVLTGFGGVDHDHAIHGVMIGPDGRLYMSNGDRGLDVTDKSGNRVHAGQDAPYQAATVLRADREGLLLEVLASNMRNPYAPAVDSFGTVYISDNDDDGNEQTRINYVMEGGNYGYWPRRKGDRRLDAVHWNEDRPGTVPKMLNTGFGSPTGILFYEGTLLPERHHRTLIHADAGPGEIRSYRPIPQGAGYHADTEVILASPEDRWFRPSDVTAAPDGSIFVADWYDPGVGGHRMGDITDGRVYRIAPPNTPYTVPPLDLDSENGLAQAFASPNLARRYLAHERLEQRALAGDTALLERLYAMGDPVLQARALWILAKHPGRGLITTLGAAQKGDAQLRTQAVRILADLGELPAAPWLLEDPGPAVRRQLLLELAPLNHREWAREWIAELAMAHDGRDRFYREAIGIAARGIEAELFSDIWSDSEERWDERTAGLAIQLHPPSALPIAQNALNDPNIALSLRELALDALDAIGGEQAGSQLAAQLEADAHPVLQARALHLLSRDEGDAWRAVLRESNMDGHLARIMEDPARRAAAWNFIRDTRRAAFIPNLLAAAESTASPETDRVQALHTVRNLASRQSTDAAQQSVTRIAALMPQAPDRVRAAAVDTLAAYRVDAAYQALRAVMEDAAHPRPLRHEAARLLAQTQSGALLLLAMAREDTMPRDLTLAVTDLVHASHFDDIRAMATQVLPRDITRGGHALPPLDELLAMRGDAQRGRDVFFSDERSQCYTCHTVHGQGRDVGPDLSRIGEKLGREGLLESILNPSAAISHEYVVWMVRTERQGYLSGYIRGEDDQTLELMDSTGNATRIRKDDIIERWQSDLSLMPTGLSAGMTAGELADLVEYLLTLR